MPYSLEYTNTADNDLSRLDARVAQRVHDAVVRLVENAEAMRHTALTGRYNGQFRLRVGDYRVLYRLDRGRRLITVVRVEHRSEAYRT